MTEPSFPVRPFGAFVLVISALFGLAGCGSGIEPLMPTPVLYTEVGLDPLDHIPEAERWVPRRVFYATNRTREPNQQRIAYGNGWSDTVSVGAALVGIGDDRMTWASLADISTSSLRDGEIALSIAGIMEKGRFAVDAPISEAAGPTGAGFMLTDLRAAIAQARDKDVLIFVHGTKVNFYNGCVFAAQLDHFMGRDLTPLAFSWPSHQNILDYAVGTDVRRAYASGEALASVIELVADNTQAQDIHILSWSAGARVAMRGLATLRARHAEEPLEALRERFRLGTVYFAAGDLPGHEFIEHAEDMHGMVDQLVVTQSNHDTALEMGHRFMGGGLRIGQRVTDLDERERALALSLERLEVVDVSLGAGERGFDITGHRYWFAHPWASSDVLLSIRTELPPERRALIPGPERILWAIPADYPARLRDLLEQTEMRGWHAHGR